MEQSMFFNAAVQSGKKVLSSTRPEMVATSTKDKFVLNDNAMRKMDLAIGDRIIMIDLFEKPGIDTQNKRFYAAKGFKHKGVDLGAVIGKNRTFSYSAIYSAIQMDDVTIRECSVGDMVRAGRGIIKEKSDNFVALQKAIMEVVPYGEFALYADTDAVPVFALTNIEFADHDPKGLDADVEDDAPEEPTTEVNTEE